MDIFTQFVRPTADAVMEHPSDVSDVRTAGYRSTAEQIQSLLDAGMRLQQSREDQYDYQSDDDITDVIDPTRSMDFDMADAAQIGLRMSAKKAPKFKPEPKPEPKPSVPGDLKPGTP